MKVKDLFEYNLPLQAFRDEDTGKVNLVNYMPRKNSASEMSLEEFDIGELDEKTFFYHVATNLMNLAILFKEFADKQRDCVYYHDEDIDKHFPPTTYAFIVKELDKYTRTKEQINES